MNRQNRDSRSQRRDIASGPRNAGKRGNYDTGEIDRYHYVDRDIYSTSRPARHGGKRYAKKKSGLKRFFVSLLCLILIVCAGVFVYGKFLMSKLDRSEDINTSKYIEQPSAAPAWGVISDNQITNILLIGTDKGDDGNSSRSDTTMLISIDSKNKTLRLVSFLRDLYVEIPTMKKQKLNAAYTKGGAALTMQTLENNFRINIDKYISVDFENFASIIDKMGGLDIKMDQKLCDAENRNMGSHLKPGVNHLDGRLAVYYARIRETDSDFGRTGRQREVMELMIKKLEGLGPIKINSLMNDFLPLVKTNLTDSELMYLATMAGSVTDYPMKTMHIPNLNTYTEPTIKGVGEVLDPDLPQNCSLLRTFLYGEDADAGESNTVSD
ncbi:LCP family protein [Caproiciproducens faecalis]|uniref:LCP family protein n=1 Tax=Caproiciproducens faecalis TaxID=2820301 RepID=A0ABS7DJQ8_9FIRM|nr:LCP family protein [Caproiciproducens faecalis]MBW7571539.1 LCP family protein [Caproiciproducens faecalis]